MAKSREEAAPPKEYLLPAETSRIEDAAVCPRDKLLIRLLRRLGCRITEVLDLEEKHIDFAQRRVKIEHQKMFSDLYCPFCHQLGESTHLGKKAIFCPRCGKRVDQAIVKKQEEHRLRKVPVDKDTLTLVRQYIKAGGVTERNGKRMLFTISRQWAGHIVRDCAERAGYLEIENPKNERKHHVHPHSFRHAFAINAIKQSTTPDDVRILQEILGHSNINTTMAYREVAGTEMREYYDKLLKEEN